MIIPNCMLPLCGDFLNLSSGRMPRVGQNTSQKKLIIYKTNHAQKERKKEEGELYGRR